ncbi:MAG: DUF3604 domain-containing protein, partial [Candidatus Latescibacteria bacterium]|nr:DUF3604 domain-containing protein [Candidatus Latescibacterota bacterium]
SPGGRIVVATRHFSDFGDPQMDDPATENYLAVQGGDGSARWQLKSDKEPRLGDSRRHPWNHGIDLVLVEGSVAAGQTVTVYLGDPDGQGPGYRCQSFVESPFRFRLGIDPDGSGAWQTVREKDSPGVEIVGAGAVAVRCVVPDATARNGQATVRIKPEDVYGNVAGTPAGDVALLLDDRTPMGRVRLEAGQTTAAQVELPRDAQWHRITAVSDDGKLFARSNPFGPSPADGLNLYFGDLHIMSGHCCGTATADQQYAYARNAAGLDFAALASLEIQMSDEDWAEIQQANRDAHEPGRFVPFLAYEWGGRSELGGDHCVYFPGDEGKLVRSRPHGDPAWNDAAVLADRERDLAETIAELRDLNPMLVPHCGGRRCNLDFFDPSVMPMLEIYSCHQTFEGAAFESVERGIRCGFIADSDDHRGAGGDSHPAARERYFTTHGGLVGVYARELTREALWEAFLAHRVYATSGPRIVLDVRINDVWMGGELDIGLGSRLEMSIQVRLEGMLDKIEVFQDSKIIHAILDKATNQIRKYDTTLSLETAQGDQAYFIRVTQEDGGRAWSSPVWVNTR